VYSHDAFLVGEAIMAVRQQCPGVRQAGYFTIDGEPVNARWRNLFESMDYIAVPSDYGQRVLDEAWPDLPVDVIPYGVDGTAYRPPSNVTRNELKKMVDGFVASQNPFKTHLAQFQDRFCVAVVGMNQSRKNLGAAYYAWKEFEKKHSDVCLFLLTHPQAPNTNIGSYDLGLMADLKTSLILYTTLPEDTYVRMLAACDCLLHPSVGEGFGLPVLEAMSAGVVPIVTDFSATTDFCTSETSYPLAWVPVVGEFNTIRAVVDTDKLVGTLEQAYQDWKSGKLATKMEIRTSSTLQPFSAPTGPKNTC
jgi:glycosyltransferase involved in cell wall biosynthesis